MKLHFVPEIGVLVSYILNDVADPIKHVILCGQLGLVLIKHLHIRQALGLFEFAVLVPLPLLALVHLSLFRRVIVVQAGRTQLPLAVQSKLHGDENLLRIVNDWLGYFAAFVLVSLCNRLILRIISLIQVDDLLELRRFLPELGDGRLQFVFDGASFAAVSFSLLALIGKRFNLA